MLQNGIKKSRKKDILQVGKLIFMHDNSIFIYSFTILFVLICYIIRFGVNQRVSQLRFVRIILQRIKYKVSEHTKNQIKPTK